jgi:hypothetical protein
MTMACRIPSRRARRRLVLPVSRFTLATERDRRDTHRALDNALRDLRRGARWRRGRALEVQPLVQMVRPANYGVFKGRWQRAWRDTEYSTAGWPKKLLDEQLGALLLPIPAGRVGLAVGDHPELVAEPLLSTGVPSEGADQGEITLGVLTTTWLPEYGAGTLLAPPILELVGRRGPLERRVEDSGLDWHLRVADGV